MSSPVLSTEWARLLVASLRRSGLRHVVLSPGSRSTPFTWAALHEPDLVCRTIIDERSAAFYAVGHARMTGEAVLLISTSGSAAANYFPAVVEAAEAAVPLLVLTADRPLELQHAAAPQTIDQVKLFGDRVRAYIELGTPDPDPRMLRAIPRLAAWAVLASRFPVPGPVHLNARARKPLDPQPAGPDDRDLRESIDRLIEGVPEAFPAEPHPSSPAIELVADACRRCRRGLIVCGPAIPAHAAAPDAVGELARRTGYPVVAEAASQLRFVGLEGVAALNAFDALLDVPDLDAATRPDVVLQVGRPPTASSWNAAMDRWSDVDRYVFSSHGWADPWSTATAMIGGPLTRGVRALAAALGDDALAPGDWIPDLRRIDRAAWRVIEESLADGFSEAAAVRAVVDRLEPGSVLAVGNSLPIREVTAFVPPGSRGIDVWSQRGANGIDGLISGAAGAASASGRPTTLLLGDVSFLHDIGGLQAARDLPAPLTVVVLNNGGGRIFERLPVAETLAGDPALDAWLTPPRVDVQAAARAFGLAYARGADPSSLTTALDTIGGTGGVVEVMVPEGGTTDHQRRLARRLEEALSG